MTFCSFCGTELSANVRFCSGCGKPVSGSKPISPEDMATIDYEAFCFFLLLMGLKWVLRKQWLAAIAFVAIFALPRGLTSSHLWLDLPAFVLVYAIAVLIVLAITAWGFYHSLGGQPLWKMEVN